MKEYTTGNDKVDYMAQLEITGNITPQIWYKTITRGTGKPYLLAIAILADIVYWYRPMEIRDEVTGQFLGYKKKFKSDILQRSYDQFAELFGETKRSVTDAVIHLETIGVIKREFRNIEVAGVTSTNILFIDFFPEKLYELTYPDMVDNSTFPVIEKEERCPEKTGEVSRNFETRNTKNTTENILSSSSTKEKEDDDEEEDVISQNFEEDIPEKQERCPEKTGEVSRKNGGGVPEFRERCPEKTGEVSRNFGTRNTKNTTENTTENILSSSSTKDEEKEDDDDAITREYFTVAKGICPEETINAVTFELKRRGSGYLQTIPPSLFLEICKNIAEYASPNIVNKSAYIKKCVDNMIAGQKLSRANAECRIRAENSFLKQGYNADNWDDFEQKILSN